MKYFYKLNGCSLEDDAPSKNIAFFNSKQPDKAELKNAVNDWLSGDSDKKQAVEDKYGKIQDWDVSNVTTFDNLFNVDYTNKPDFNEDISKWNVSKAGFDEDSGVGCRGMFAGCEKFNQDISGWNLQNCENFDEFFRDCKAFNQDISGWKVDNCESFVSTFENCISFNQDLSSWKTNQVQNFDSMFKNCKNFNQDLSNWVVNPIVYGTPKKTIFWALDMFKGATSMKLENVPIKLLEGPSGPCAALSKRLCQDLKHIGYVDGAAEIQPHQWQGISSVEAKKHLSTTRPVVTNPPRVGLGFPAID